MNKARRAELNRIINTLTDLKYDIEAVKDDEESAMDNLPESLQCSDRESAVDAMDEAYSYIEDAISNLEDAME